MLQSSLNNLSDPFALKKGNVPEQSEVDIVAELEKDLRSEKKATVKTDQSQIVGGSSAVLPDIIDGDNEYLKNKVQRYAMQDNVPPAASTSSMLGDFSRLLAMSSESPIENSGFARNQLMQMQFSTLDNASSQAERIVESQMGYDLAASSFGLNSKSNKSYKHAKKNSKLLNNAFY